LTDKRSMPWPSGRLWGGRKHPGFGRSGVGERSGGRA
jgi:hypothetical protein